MGDNEIKQLEGILDYLTANFEFNTFTRYVNEKSKQLNYVMGIEFLEKYKGGDCLNFGKALIDLSKNPNLSIIGALPQLEKCSKSQADFMQYGHTAVLLSKDGKRYLAEPTMRLNRLIPIKNNTSIENDEQIFEISNVSSKGFTLRTITKSKYNANSENDFLFYPIDEELFNDLPRRYRLLKRNLHIVNRVTKDIPRYYLKYEVENNNFKSNISEAVENISLEDLAGFNSLWNKFFINENLADFIQSLMYNYTTFRNDFVN